MADVRHRRVTNAPADPKALVDGPAWDDAHTGLEFVDNTSDANKPISTATQTALNAKVTGPASVTDDLPAIFDGTTGKLIKSKTYAAFKTLLALVKGDVGLGNVDNTSDASKPVSTAQVTALNLKANLASPSFTGTVTVAGAGGVVMANVAGVSWLNHLGTGNGTQVFVYSDDNMYIDNLNVGGQINLRTAGFATQATVSSTGVNLFNSPTAPTPTAGDNSTKLATTSYVDRTTRERLTANRTYYVLTTGSDSNTGLVNTSGGAFLTLQKAANTVLRTIDANGFNVTIDITGAYTTGVTFSGPMEGGGTLTITSTAGASITTTSANAVAASGGCRLTVNGSLTLSTVTSGVALLAGAGGYISTSGLTFGPAATGHMQAGWNAPSGIDSGGGVIDITGNYTITGGGGGHLHATTEGAMIHYVYTPTPVTVTITGTPAFSNFFAGVTKGMIFAFGVTFSGSATGPRYLVHNGGGIVGLSRTSLPGNVGGTVGAAGFYSTAVSDADSDFGVGDIFLHPSASLTPATNGDLCIQATSNTSLTFKYKGSDGTVRSGSITLS